MYINTYLHIYTLHKSLSSLELFLAASKLLLSNPIWRSFSARQGYCSIRDFSNYVKYIYQVIQQDNRMKHFCHLVPLTFLYAASSWKIHSPPECVALQHQALQTNH